MGLFKLNWNKKKLNFIRCKSFENQADSIRDFKLNECEPSIQFESNRINPRSDRSKPNFQLKSLRIIPTSDSSDLILVSEIRFRLI